MNWLDPAFLGGLGNDVDQVGQWLAKYPLIVLLPLSVLAAVSIYFKNRAKSSAETYGLIAKAVGSGASLLTSLILLLPLVARALWGTATGTPPSVPACLAASKLPCNAEIAQYLNLLSRSTVAMSTLLGVAVFLAFLASIVWFIASIRDAFK